MALEELYNQVFQQKSSVLPSSSLHRRETTANAHVFSRPAGNNAVYGAFTSGKTVSIMEPIVTSAALPLVSGRNKPLLDRLTELMVQERMRSNILPNKLEVTVHVDAETNKKLLHINLTMSHLER